MSEQLTQIDLTQTPTPAEILRVTCDDKIRDAAAEKGVPPNALTLAIRVFRQSKHKYTMHLIQIGLFLPDKDAA